MIRFENDARTRGEQFVLRSILLGAPLARCDWHGLHAKDFAHDLHGRIFRHADRLAAQGIWHDTQAVYLSMRDERRGRGMEGVAGYLAWLVSDDPCFATGRVEALIAFQDAMADEHEADARAEAMRGRK